MSTKLKLIAALTALALLLLGYQGFSGMHHAERVIEKLHRQGIQNSISAGEILYTLGDVRNELQLALQHTPGNSFIQLHQDHPVDLHIQRINQSLKQLHAIVNKLQAAELNTADRTKLKQLTSTMDELTTKGIVPILNALRKDQYLGYLEASRLQVAEIYPRIDPIVKNTEAFLKLQVQAGEEFYLQAKQDTQSFLLLVSIFTGVSLLVILVASSSVHRRVNSAVSQLDRASTDIAAGNLTRRVNSDGSDELAHIANTVNLIAERFQHALITTQGSVDQLARSAEENAGVSAQTQRNVREQQHQTQQVATAIHQMSATVKEVAQNAASAAEASLLAESAAANGQQVVQESSCMIEQLVDAVANATYAMHQLERDIEEIGGVVDVIKGISEQTNLLALNAAIEAARAGEQGRGFAVVADEVRTLAKRTQDSTKDIQQMIQRLQQGSKNTVGTMAKGTEQAKLSAGKAQQAGDVLQQIIASVSKINLMNAQIATAAEQQQAVTEEINRNITNISDISEETATGTEQVSTATQQLAKLAESMRQEVAHYQI